MSNPFEDPDVKAATKSYENGAYDDVEMNDNNTQTAYNTNVSVKVDSGASSTAANIGKTIATNEMNNINNERKEANKVIQDHNERPPPPAWLEKCFAWLPIRTFAYFGGWFFAVLPWIDLIFISGSDLTFSTFFLLFYIMLFGIVIIMIESPTWRCTRKPQLGIYFWARFCSRMWGRASFYVFISILSFGFFDQFTSTTGLAGIYMLIVALLMLYVSYSASKKYVRIFVYIAAGSEGDLLKERFERKFNELDIDGDGKIGSEAIVKIALEAGRTLTNAERHAIQSFLDESCNGSVSREDWMRQFLNNNMKQKFL